MFGKVEIVEKNVIKKKIRRGIFRVAIAYPSTYMVGMSSLSIHLLYNILNNIDFVYAERVFMEGSGPYRSVETGTLLRDFDLILFSVHYELDYVNIVKMLERSGINPISRYRNRKPIVIVGGPTVTANPEPVADIADIVFLGEVEPVIDKIIERIYISKNIEDLADIEGIYIPSLGKYEVKVVKSLNLDNTQYPTRQIITLKAPKNYTPVFGKAYFLEICRGCPYLCKFCMESHIQHPFRYRSFSNIVRILESSELDEDIDKIVIIGLGAQSHPDFRKIIQYLLDNYNLEISVPSLRTDVLEEEDIELISRTGQKALTIAPENSEKIRMFLGKYFGNDKIFKICELSRKYGFDHIKLYFIIGIPNEDDNDIKECVDIVRKVCKIFNGNVYVSVNPWIRKPQTPLQYMKPLDMDVVDKRIKYFVENLNCRYTTYDIFLAYAQMLLSLGDRDVSKIIIDASRLEMSNLSRSLWRRILRKYSDLFKKYVFSQYDINSELPWSHVKSSIDSRILWRRYEESISMFSRGNNL